MFIKNLMLYGGRMKGKILFYAHVKDVSLLYDISFYEQDIRSFKENGFEVIVTNRYSDVILKNYDYIYIWWWTYALFPILWNKLFLRKSIVAGAFHYSTPLTSGGDFVRKNIFYKFLIKASLKLANANVFVSKIEFSKVVENLNVANPHLVYHGIDTINYFSVDRKEINQSDNHIEILMISWLEVNNIERKCVKESVEAVCNLYTAGFNVSLKLAGRRGPGFNEFENFLNSLEGSECISLLGHISESEKINFLQTSHIFLSPTLYEGFGVAIAEAMSCGCAVITSPNGAVPEVTGKCAVYCDPRSVESIQDSIQYLLKNVAILKRNSDCGSQRIQEKFSYIDHKKSLIAVLDKFFI